MATVNAHVSRLRRYLPFDPGHAQIYEERSDPSQLRTIETAASRTLEALVRDPETRLVVLTGDAGHGKTHLCRVALESALGVEAAEAQGLLRERGDGAQEVGRVDNRALFVIKDLSELKQSAAPRLEDAVASEDRVTLVCANEGKLREVVAERSERLSVLRETLEETQRSGRVAIREGIVVIDLNYQSITAGGEKSFLTGILNQWALDGRRWSVCSRCNAWEVCPILSNRSQLSGEDDGVAGTNRREGLSLLLRVAEQSGTSITIREALILVAFALTGGTSCEEVQKDPGATRADFRARTYYQVLFDPPLKKDQRASLPLLKALARLDPGRNAIRSVDEALVSGPRDDLDLEELANSTGKPSTRRQLRSEAERHRAALAALRRRDYFDLRTNDEWKRLRSDDVPTVPRAERLGFRHHADFEAVVGVGEGGTPASLRDLILVGLEAVQDVRRGSKQMMRFCVVDPAYGNVAGLASILANEISVKRITVMPQGYFWNTGPQGERLLSDLVDWVDRRVVVRFSHSQRDAVTVELDLLQFEFVLRSAQGLASRSFFQGDIRRIVARLNLLAQDGSHGDEDIIVIYEDKPYRILVEDDGRIKCEAGS